jgi:hypothetical protein
MVAYLLFLLLLCLFLYDTQKRVMRFDFVSNQKESLTFLFLGAAPFIVGIGVAFAYSVLVMPP